MVNNKELIGTTEFRTLYMRYGINRCRYKQVRLYLYLGLFTSEALLVLHIQYRGKLPTESTNDNHTCFFQRRTYSAGG